MALRSTARALVLAALAAALGPGCTSECIPRAMASISLEIVDAQTGDPVDARVSYLLDAAGPLDADEDEPGRYTLGLEDAGTFDVTVEADGYQTAMEQYVVRDGECNVQAVSDTIELSPAP